MSIAERLRLNVANRLDTPIHESREAADELDRLTKRVAELEGQNAAFRDMLQVVYDWCVSDNPSDIDGDAVKALLDSPNSARGWVKLNWRAANDKPERGRLIQLPDVRKKMDKTPRQLAEELVGDNDDPEAVGALTRDLEKIEALGIRKGLLHAAQICRTMGGNHRDSMIRDICVNCSRSILAEARKVGGE